MKITTATAQGGRSHQEDRFVVHDNQLAVLCDGHGGHECADEVIRLFPALWEKSKPRESYEEVIQDVFRQVGEITAFYSSGCTCSVVSIDGDGDGWVAILGDSPVVVKARRRARTFACHNAIVNENEREAAIKRGAHYDAPYLWNQHGQGLQMSRAFGDASLSFLSREPDIYSFRNADWVVLCTDGMFYSHDVDPLTLAPLIDAGADAQSLVDQAVAQRNGDNVTAILFSR